MPGNGTNKTTGLVSAYQNGSDDAYTYTYDDNGNITEITQGSTSITCEYDTANRLTRENNGLTNETVTYEYDTWGNILNKKIYAYTTGDLTDLTYTQIDYAYTNTAWGDQLTSYDGQTITYDSMGNPLNYRGYIFGWRGKQLISAGNGTDTITFEYNEDGLRQKKTVNNVDTDYFYNGSVLIGMQQNNDVLRFSYDASGNVVSVNYNGTEYYYLRNAQGDIVKLIDASGASVVEYTYDTWGKEVQITGSLASTLGLIQPFRYRGYVYDEETGFYYLQSRYYDPTTGRFVSADVMLSTGQGVLGHNAFAYCRNNPCSRYDTSGKEDDWTDELIFPGGDEDTHVSVDYLNSFCRVIYSYSGITCKNGKATFSLYIPGCEKEIYNAVRTLGKDYTYDLMVYVAEVRLKRINDNYSISDKNKKALKNKINDKVGKYMSTDHPKVFGKRTLQMRISFLFGKIYPDRKDGFIREYKRLYKNLKAEFRYDED